MAKGKKTPDPKPIKYTHFIVLKVEKDSIDPVMTDDELKKWASDLVAGADYGEVTVEMVSDEDPRVDDLDGEDEKEEEDTDEEDTDTDDDADDESVDEDDE